jgi:hypothetical protein
MSNEMHTILPEGLAGEDLLIMVSVSDAAGGISNITKKVTLSSIENKSADEI